MKQTYSPSLRYADTDDLVNLVAASSLLKEKTRISLYLPKAVVKIMDSIAKNQSRSELVKNLVVEKAGKAKRPRKQDYFGIFSDAKITDKDIDEVTHSWDRYVDKLVKEL